MTTGQTIKAVEFNAIRDKVEQILDSGGTVGGIRGYGQILISTPVQASLGTNDIDGDPDSITKITKAQWEALRRDIINIKIHQENPKGSDGNPIVPNVISIPENDPIRFGSNHPNTNFNNLIDQLTITSLNIAEGRSLLTSATGSPAITSATWASLATCEVEITFNGYTRSDNVPVSALNHARFFFNSGGKFRLYSRRIGGTVSAQNNSWSSLLVQAGIREFSALGPANLNFYNLTDGYQTLYQLFSSGAYSTNTFLIEAKCDVPTNQTATATKVFFRISWIDGYQDTDPFTLPADLIDGTLQLFVEEVKAVGPIFNSISGQTPTGTFVIPSPTYQISPINVS